MLLVWYTGRCETKVERKQTIRFRCLPFGVIIARWHRQAYIHLLVSANLLIVVCEIDSKRMPI